MSNQKLVMYFTLLSIMFLGYFGAVAENEFYVKQKSQLEEKKIETEAKQETLQKELQEIIKKENVEKTKDLEFSKRMSEMKGQVMEVSHYSEKDSCHYPVKGGCLTASGKIAKIGMIATNLYPFGTKLLIGGQEYIVEDRISKRYGQTRIDVWTGYGEEAYQTAKANGIKYLEVVKL